MNTLEIKTAMNKYSLSFTADNALNCELTREAIKSYFINKFAASEFEQTLIEFLHCEYNHAYFSNLYHLNGQNLLSSHAVQYKFTLKDGIVSLCITHHITKEHSI